MGSSLRIAVYHNLHSGGALRTLSEQVRRLSQRHVVTLFSLTMAESVEADSMEHRLWSFRPGPDLRRPLGRLNRIVRAADLMRLVRLNRAVAQAIDSGGFDVVLVHPCQFSQAPAILRYLRTPSVYYCHEALRSLYESPIPRPDLRRSSLHRIMDVVDPGLWFQRRTLRHNDRQAIRSATRVLVNSAYTRDNVGRIYGVDGFICRHGVDTTRFRPLDLQQEGLVLSVGALTPYKGFDFLIEALATLPPAVRPPLHIISNYAERREWAYLEGLARERGVALEVRVRVDDAELVEAYNRAVLIAYAPHREPLGLVPLEAMACGRPVVGVKEGGVVETVLHERTGFLVERDPRGFAIAVGRLLQDTELRCRYGQNAREYVLEHWAWASAVRRLESFLVEVADHH